MSISSQDVQALRKATGAGMMDAKQALTEANGDTAQALVILRKKGVLKAAHKAARETHEGRIESYIHANGKIGVLLALYSETDFVARNDQFRELAHDLAMHIAGMNPRYISPELIPADVLEAERHIYEEEVQNITKPDNIKKEIIEGKMKKFADEVSLLEQPFLKDSDKKVRDIVNEYISRLGENIQIGAFTRYEI